MKYLMLIIFIFIASSAFGDVFQFRPHLGIIDSGCMEINLDYATSNDNKINNADDLFPLKTNIFYILQCDGVEYFDGVKLYYMKLVVPLIIENYKEYSVENNNKFIISFIEKSNGTISFWDSKSNNLPKSLKILFNLIQPLTMSFYYPLKDLNDVNMWSKKYNWPPKREGELIFNGEFYLKNYDMQTVDIQNDVYFVMPNTKSFNELNMFNVSGHLMSSYQINPKTSSINVFDGRLTLKYQEEDDIITLFIDISKLNKERD